MKTEIKYLLELLITLLVIYALGYFLSGQLNPMNYPTYGKIIFLITIVLGLRNSLED